MIFDILVLSLGTWSVYRQHIVRVSVFMLDTFLLTLSNGCGVRALLCLHEACSLWGFAYCDIVDIGRTFIEYHKKGSPKSIYILSGDGTCTYC